MLKHNLLITSLLILCLSNAFSQKVTISGYVSDASNNERLISATVNSINHKQYCITNEQGFYSLTVEKGPIKLRASYVGYSSAIKSFSIKADTTVNFLLKPSSSIGEVVVTSDVHRLDPNTQKIPIREISKLPALVGEPDVMKTLQLMPGVQSGSEGQTNFYIKGGEGDQNLILLDGVPVYNPNHFFGFFSIFNEHAIQNITVYKGNFPARYGGRLSSVIDIRTKEGNGKKIEGSASVGVLSTTADIDGPLFNSKTTFFASGRISYMQFFATPLVKRLTPYSTDIYRFYDYNGKITHRFNNKQKLIFSYYHSYDHGITDESLQNQLNLYRWNETSEWGNHISSLTWNYAVTPRLFMNTIINYSKYYYIYFTQNQLNSGTQSDNLFKETVSDITDKGLQTNLTWYALSKSTFRAGMGYHLLKFVPGVDVDRVTNIKIYNSSGKPMSLNIDTTLGYTNIRPKEFTAYIEDEIKAGEKLTITPGLRYVNYHNSVLYQELEPRLNLTWQLGKTTLNASYTAATQFNHLLTTSEISQATDLWVPSTKSIQPEKSQQVSIGLTYSLPKGMDVSAEAYYKQLSHLLEYKEGATYFTSTTSWENMVTSGKGKAYGLIFALEKKAGKTTGWISYAWSKSVRKFPDINFGQEFPFAYSRPNDLKIVVMYKFSGHFNASATWVYHSGNNITYGDIKYFWMFLYMKHNGYRLPAYQRLDLNVNYHFHTKHLEHNLSLSVYNAYNRKNIYNLEYYDISGSHPLIRQRSLLPIIPSLTYRIKF